MFVVVVVCHIVKFWNDEIMEEEISYEEFLCFCEQWNIEPLDESSDWEQQYRDNVEYMQTGEGYPTGLR